MSGRLGWLARDLRTARHIPAAQLAQRLRFLVLRRRYARGPAAPIVRARAAAAECREVRPLPRVEADVLFPGTLAAAESRARDVAERRFTHLGTTAHYTGDIEWVDAARSPLWQYQMHYLGSVLDLAVGGDTGGNTGAAAALLSSWSRAHGDAWDRVAWHPYPVSLRLANLCFAAGCAGSFAALGPSALATAATHTAYLLEHLERDVRGNHLFENARALLVASRHLSGPLAERAARVGAALLEDELPEQVLPDGGHFERSPMYHVIVLHGVLQLIAALGPDSSLVRELLAPTAARMAAFLTRIVCPDGGIPLLGDSARSFAPPADAVIALAERLVGKRDLPDDTDAACFVAGDTGLAVFRSASTWAALDVGPICPTYLPAHGQADTLTVEVWMHGVPLVTDPGLGEYTGPERAWGRSSRAHSTLTLDDRDHSEVYGSFRVGGRERLGPLVIDDLGVSRELRPWRRDGATLRRTVRLVTSGGLRLDDEATGHGASVARSRLHLAPGVRILSTQDDGRTLRLGTAGGDVRITAHATPTREAGRCSRTFGATEATTILVQDLVGDGRRATGHWELTPWVAAPQEDC